MTREDIFYGNPDRLDLGKIRAEAEKKSAGRGWGSHPRLVVIHHHHKDESCAQRVHDEYPPKEK